MHIHIAALGGQSDAFQLRPLLVPLEGSGLRLLFGIDRRCSHLLFATASAEGLSDSRQGTNQESALELAQKSARK